MTDPLFQAALRPLLAHEGGYSNRNLKDDPGGATNKGVTQAAYDAYRDLKGVGHRDVRQLTQIELEDIYGGYWKSAGCDRLPPGLGYAVFDFAVNSGAHQAVVELQRLVGVGVDGHAGLFTAAAARKAYDQDPAHTIASYCERRLAFMRTLRNWGANKNGWTRRVMGAHAGFQVDDNGVIDLAVMMAKQEPIATKDLPRPVASNGSPGGVAEKASPADQAVHKTPMGLGAITGTVGTVGSVASAVGEAASKTGDATTATVDTAGKVVKVVHHAHSLLHTVGVDVIIGVCAVLALLGLALVLWAVWHRIRERGGGFESRGLFNAIEGLIGGHHAPILQNQGTQP